MDNNLFYSSHGFAVEHRLELPSEMAKEGVESLSEKYLESINILNPVQVIQ